MRRITEEAHRAFVTKRRFKKSNTEVKIVNGLPQLYLFNNKIAEMNEFGDIIIQSANWFSRTTRDRLSSFCRIRMSNGQYIINESFAWDGRQLNLNKL